MERKRRRTDEGKLQELVTIKNVSLHAVQRILNATSSEEDAVSWRQLQKTNRSRFEQVKHTITLPAEDGGEVAISMAHPMRLLTLLLHENANFRTWFEESWRTRPSSTTQPWQLLVGWDEFVPGNKLALQNNRKTMVLNFAFLEMRRHLSCDAAWVTPLAIRSSVAQGSVVPKRVLTCMFGFE